MIHELACSDEITKSEHEQYFYYRSVYDDQRGSCPNDEEWDNLYELYVNEDLPDYIAYVKVYDEPSNKPNIFTKSWNELIQQDYIPYDLEERKKQLSHAYEELKDYIAYHERRMKEEEEQITIEDKK